MYERLKVQIQNKISQALTANVTFAFTTDGWTSRAVQSYISLTVHYFTDDFQLKHYMLSLKHVPEKHTYKYLQSTLLQCFNIWKIDLEQNAFFTTDNGRNLAKAIDTQLHWTRILCFGHCLQLVIKCAMKNFKRYDELRKKCRSIVTYFSKSTTGREKLINVQKSLSPTVVPLQLIQEVDTRWNSTYLMFTRFITLHTTLNIILCEDNVPDNLTSEDWSFLESVTTVLEPIKDATEIMSGDIYPTISLYYPMYYSILNVVRIESDENTFIVDISNKLQIALQQRFEPIVKNPIYLYSMVLDPRYKDHLLPAEQKQTIYDQLSEQITKLHSQQLDNIGDTNEQNIPGTSGNGGRRSKLLTFLNTTLGNPDSLSDVQSFSNRRDAELRTYLSESLVSMNTNIMDWWKSNHIRFPLLSAAVKRFLAIPATQVTSERLFSTSGNIITPTRTRLLPENVEQLCFLHSNSNKML